MSVKEILQNYSFTSIWGNCIFFLHFPQIGGYTAQAFNTISCGNWLHFTSSGFHLR